jgi:poly-gamma-glutamate synthesis protein (capsule biosynthesis protein)
MGGSGIWLLAGVALLVVACANEASAPGHEDPTPEPTSSATTSPTPRPTATPEPTPAPLTLAGVFPPRELPPGLDPSRMRTVIATGDVIPARYTDVQIRNRGDDFLWPVAATSGLTSGADLTVINLEAPVIERCPYHDSGFIFCGRPGIIGAFQQAGVDVVTMENNHIGNWGASGIAETEQRLDGAGLRRADRDTPAIVDVRGLTFGFLAFNAVGERIDRPAMQAQIQALRPQVDVLSVSYHWGVEYTSVPYPGAGIAEDDPVEIGHLAVDAGADLVIGNHPHWVQGVELYKEGFIAYAHGNFIFDQMWSYETRVGVVGKYTFYDERLVRAEYHPVRSIDYGQPVPMSGPEAQAVLDGMKASSEAIAAGRP